MSKLSKIMIMYSILIGIIGNFLEIYYTHEEFFLPQLTMKLIALWCVISSIHLFIEVKREKKQRNYRKVVEFLVVGISLSMALIGTIGVCMFLIITYPRGWIRIVSLTLSIPPIVYFLKKYWNQES